MPNPAYASSARAEAAGPASDRRRGQDRRQRHDGPPQGLRDRRVHVEARRPLVEELEMTLEEFQQLMEQTAAPELDRSAVDMAAARVAAARDRHRG
jgi:hypothetical protein